MDMERDDLRRKVKIKEKFQKYYSLEGSKVICMLIRMFVWDVCTTVEYSIAYACVTTPEENNKMRSTKCSAADYVTTNLVHFCLSIGCIGKFFVHFLNLIFFYWLSFEVFCVVYWMNECILCMLTCARTKKHSFFICMKNIWNWSLLGVIKWCNFFIEKEQKLCTENGCKQSLIAYRDLFYSLLCEFHMILGRAYAFFIIFYIHTHEKY